VEKVTGNITDAEAMAPAEEQGQSVSGDESATVPDAEPDVREEGKTAAIAHDGGDPWLALADVGASLLSAFTRGSAAQAGYQWVETDPATGAKSLRIPLPPPEVAEQLANGLAVLADALRTRASRSAVAADTNLKA
jgi:hypothetical protein